MAPDRSTFKKARKEIPVFSPVMPDYNSPIEKGLRGLQNGAKNLRSVGPLTGNWASIQSQTIDEIGENSDHEFVVEPMELPENNPIQTSGDQLTGSTQVSSTQTGNISIKKVRGLTIGKGIMKSNIASGRKMKITVDPSVGRPIDSNESAKFASQVGVMTHDVLPVPKKWKDLDKDKDLKLALDHLYIQLDVNTNDPGVMDSIFDRVQYSSRQQRHRFHKHFLNYPTLEDAKKNRPPTCGDQKHWEDLCDHFSTDKFKVPTKMHDFQYLYHASTVNKANRKLLKAPHLSGRKAFTVRRNEIQKEKNGEYCDAIELYKDTHYSNKKGWSSKGAEENWNLMKEKEHQNHQDGVLETADEIVEKVLGRGSGYIKGLGYGPKPPSTRKNDFVTQHLEKELLKTREKLKNSEDKVEELTSNMSSMQNKLVEQDASIQKLMAYMQANIQRVDGSGEA